MERKVEPSPFFTGENVVFTRFKDGAWVEEEIPLVFCNDTVVGYVKFVCERRGLEFEDVVTKGGIDGSGRFIKMALSIIRKSEFSCLSSSSRVRRVKGISGRARES